MKIIVHKMKDCHLCNRVDKMFAQFNIEYESVLDEPPKDKPYPIVFIDDEEFSLEEICCKIFRGELGE